MIFKDYYKLLELETNRVALDEIKVAYRAVAKKYHPDVNVGDTLAEERIKDINEAYRVLANPQMKRKYDRIWNSNANRKKKAFSKQGKKSDTVFNNFFYMFLGDIESSNPNKKEKLIPIKGENIETGININIAEAFNGTHKKITLKNINEKEKTVTVPIPEGIRSGDKVRVVGQGKEGKNGGKNGDLFIKININKSEKYKIQGNDLYTELLISPWEAILGTKIEIDSIDGVATVYIPKGTQTGENIRIPGKGYKNKDGKRGDLVAKIKIVVPKELTKQEQELFEKLNKVSTYNPRNLTN